jgi:hypothetical protein
VLAVVSAGQAVFRYVIQGYVEVQTEASYACFVSLSFVLLAGTPRVGSDVKTERDGPLPCVMPCTVPATQLVGCYHPIILPRFPPHIVIQVVVTGSAHSGVMRCHNVSWLESICIMMLVSGWQPSQVNSKDAVPGMPTTAQ